MFKFKPAKPTRWTRKLTLRVGFIAIALLGTSALGYAVSAGSAAGQSAAATPSPSALPGPMPGAPSLHVIPAAAAAPNMLYPSNATQVKSWDAGNNGTALARITGYSGNVLMAYGSRDYAQMLQACAALAGAVKAAQVLPAIPDTAMQKMYVASLLAFAAGAVACETGITQTENGVEGDVTHVNQAEISSALSQFNVGAKDLYLATEVLRAVPKPTAKVSAVRAGGVG
jgi:hypothetical protein